MPILLRLAAARHRFVPARIALGQYVLALLPNPPSITK